MVIIEQEKLLGIYGSGGLGREVLDIAKESNKWNKIIFVDDFTTSNFVNETEVLNLNRLLELYPNFKISIIVAVGEPKIRQEIIEKISFYNIDFANIYSAGFRKPSFSKIGTGNFFHIGSLMITNLTIGNNCFFNKNCVIGHDTFIGNGIMISPGVTIGGCTVIGDYTFIGSGAIIRDHIIIGKNSIIGMGAVVINNVPDNSVVVGNPAKVIRSSNDDKVFK